MLSTKAQHCSVSEEEDAEDQSSFGQEQRKTVVF